MEYAFPPESMTQSSGAVVLVMQVLIALLVLGGIYGLYAMFRKPGRFRDQYLWYGYFVIVAVVGSVIAVSDLNGDDYPLVLSYLLFAWLLSAIGAAAAILRDPNKNFTFSVTIALVCVLSMGLMLSLTLPNLAFFRPGIQWETAKDRLRRIGIAVNQYHKTHDALPPAVIAPDSEAPMSWRVHVLSSVEGQKLYSQYDATKPWDAEENQKVAARMPGSIIYSCPANPMPKDEQGRYYSAYAMLTGPNTLATEGSRGSWWDRKGKSQIAIIGEASGQRIIWTEPRDIDTTKLKPGINGPGETEGRSSTWLSTYHSGGAILLMADGGVRELDLETDPEVLKELILAVPEQEPEATEEPPTGEARETSSLLSDEEF